MLLAADQPASWRASRAIALGLATLSVAAIVVALALGTLAGSSGGVSARYRFHDVGP
jgi:hypothetical protein